MTYDRLLFALIESSSPQSSGLVLIAAARSSDSITQPKLDVSVHDTNPCPLPSCSSIFITPRRQKDLLLHLSSNMPLRSGHESEFSTRSDARHGQECWLLPSLLCSLRRFPCLSSSSHHPPHHPAPEKLHAVLHVHERMSLHRHDIGDLSSVTSLGRTDRSGAVTSSSHQGQVLWLDHHLLPPFTHIDGGPLSMRLIRRHWRCHRPGRWLDLQMGQPTDVRLWCLAVALPPLPHIRAPPRPQHLLRRTFHASGSVLGVALEVHSCLAGRPTGLE